MNKQPSGTVSFVSFSFSAPRLLSRGLSFPAATTGRAPPPSARSSPATSILQVCPSLPFPSLPFPSCCVKSNPPNANVCMLFIFGSDHVFTYKVRFFATIIGVHPCPILYPAPAPHLCLISYLCTCR